MNNSILICYKTQFNLEQRI